jgi:predicted PurR-regulated permease PerM
MSRRHPNKEADDIANHSAGGAPSGRLAPDEQWARDPRALIVSETIALMPSLKLLVGLLTMAVVIAGLYFGRELLIPLALAMLLGFLLDPLVTRLKRVGVPRVAAVLLVVAAVLCVLAGASLLLGQQVRMLAAELPTYQTTMRDKLRGVRETMSSPGVFERAMRTFDQVEREISGENDKKKTAEDEAVASAPPPPVFEPVPDSDGKPEEPPPPPLVQIQERPPTAMEQAGAWLARIGDLLGTAGIVLLFLVLILLGRNDLRDRMLRLMGGNLHRSTDAMTEASARISRYLAMQLVVNVTYAIPMTLGLWLIGVPGAILWGVVAAVMRFVPYVGPVISAMFPLLLAFATDPGWDILLWTIGLILVLELISNNIIEPWLYGASTGLSTISLISAALFWTALWGPIGLLLSTPLTVCLLVLGRHLPQFKFFDVLLGSEPVLDAPTRLYQRLLAGDVEEAIDMATDEIEETQATGRAPVLDFYSNTGIPALRLASSDHANVATAEHRLRMIDGMLALIEDLREQYPSPDTAGPVQVVCIGGRWEMDTLAANMLAHGLALQGCHADFLNTVPAFTPKFFTRLDLGGADVVCLSYFSPAPEAHVRYASRRLRRNAPRLRIVAALWNAPPELLDPDAMSRLGVDAIATTVHEVALQVASLREQHDPEGYAPAPVPEGDAARVLALRNSGALNSVNLAAFNVAAQRAADIFDVKLALVSLVDDQWMLAQGASGDMPTPPEEEGQPGMMKRDMSLCAHVVAADDTLVVPDISRDPRFAANPALTRRGIRFYAGAPLRDAQGNVLGSFCLLDDEPRTMSAREIRMLEAMASDVMANLGQQAGTTQPAPEAAEEEGHVAGGAAIGSPGN